MDIDYFNSHVYLVEYAGGTTFVDTSPTCYVSSHYSIYSKLKRWMKWKVRARHLFYESNSSG